MKLTLKLQGDSGQIVRELAPGWNHIVHSLGAHVLDGAVVFSNGAVDPSGDLTTGAVFFDYIRLDYDGGRWGWEGQEVFPSRCVFPVRTKPITNLSYRDEEGLPQPRAQLTDWARTRAKALADYIASRSVAPNVALDLPLGRLGMWTPMGEPQPGAPGGDGIEPFGGWERCSEYRLLCADLTIQRNPLAYLDARTGEPIRGQEAYYSLARGETDTTQVTAFHGQKVDQWTTRRHPKLANLGTTQALEKKLGVDRYAGMLPHDGQHLVRAFRHAETGWRMYGDEACRLYLRIIGADAALAWPEKKLVGLMTNAHRQAGAPWAGREAYWALAAWNHAGMEEEAARMSRALDAVGMVNGFHQRCEYGPPWGFAPDPWRDNGVPYTDAVCQNIEEGIKAWCVQYTNKHATARCADALTLRGVPRKWLTVARASGVVYSGENVRQYGSYDTYNVWFAMAAWSKTANRRDIIQRMTTIPPPGEGAAYNDVKKTYDALLKNPYWTHTASAVRELERAL